MFGVVVILIDALANFRRRYPHNGVGIGVVVGGAIEDLYSEDALLELPPLTIQRTRDHKSQKLAISPTGIK